MHKAQHFRCIIWIIAQCFWMPFRVRVTNRQMATFPLYSAPLVWWIRCRGLYLWRIQVQVGQRSKFVPNPIDFKWENSGMRIPKIECHFSKISPWISAEQHVIDGCRLRALQNEPGQNNHFTWISALALEMQTAHPCWWDVSVAAAFDMCFV